MISVVVPARDVAGDLARCLAALPAGTDVVVVDDGSVDGTGDVARRAGARVVRGTGDGPAAARNLGVAVAQGDLLAFTDADCVPAPGWLDAVARAFAGGADLVRGPVEPVRTMPPPTPWDRTLWVAESSPRFETANLAVRRATFDAVGGFARLRGGPRRAHFGEDALFGWRAVRTEARVAWAPDALVRHAVHRRGPAGFVAERARLRFFPALAREVPELRAAMPARLFLDGRTARVDLAVAGLALAAGGRRAWALAALPYAALRPHPVRIAADVVGAAALLWGSVRARRPVL